mmetsp:Transcript_16097/g.42268  ORF Transcript_16097/g.42268 Transcript_16097/m.42268 type:complete len:162 (+) Transcript_16097:64-549(+)
MRVLVCLLMACWWTVAHAMAVVRPPRPIPAPQGPDAKVVSVCTDPKRSCGIRGGAEIVQMFKDVIAEEGREGVAVTECSCVGPCSLSVNVVAGWKDQKGKFARALIQRDPENDPASKMSRSARLKTKPGVYTSVTTREDCVAILDALDEKMDAAIGGGDGA